MSYDLNQKGPISSLLSNFILKISSYTVRDLERLMPVSGVRALQALCAWP